MNFKTLINRGVGGVNRRLKFNSFIERVIEKGDAKIKHNY